jgi:hypothetical protein
MELKITDVTKKKIRDAIYLDSVLPTNMENREYLFEVVNRLAKKFPNDVELGQIVRHHLNENIFNEQA